MTLEVMGLRCCGARELHGIQRPMGIGVNGKPTCPTPEACMKALAEHWTYRGYWTTNQREPTSRVKSRPLVFFSYSKAYTKGMEGDKLVSYIQKNKLGTVHKTKWVKNTNSNNIIRGYLWTVDCEAFDKMFAIKEKNHVAKTPR